MICDGSRIEVTRRDSPCTRCGASAGTEEMPDQSRRTLAHTAPDDPYGLDAWERREMTRCAPDSGSDRP